MRLCDRPHGGFFSQGNYCAVHGRREYPLRQALSRPDVPADFQVIAEGLLALLHGQTVALMRAAGRPLGFIGFRWLLEHGVAPRVLPQERSDVMGRFGQFRSELI